MTERVAKVRAVAKRQAPGTAVGGAIGVGLTALLAWQTQGDKAEALVHALDTVEACTNAKHLHADRMQDSLDVCHETVKELALRLGSP